MLDLQGKLVLVTGGCGFLGKQIVQRLWARKASTYVPRSAEFDLVDFHQTMKMMETWKPDIVIHCAAFYGGIWINKLYPGDIYFKNLMMGANVIEASRKADVKKFVGVGTACSYPAHLDWDRDYKESDLWNGICHESVRCYGMVKKMMAIQCEAYKKQWGFNGIHLLLANLYGEDDSYNPERSHVVAALIRKFVEAKMNGEKEVEVWGSGRPVREFLYVGDAAEAIVRATEAYDDVQPLNIGTGVGTSIKELVDKVSAIVGFEGEVRWNSSKPDGQMRKVFDVSRMKETLKWEPETSLVEGLGRTITWFRKNYDEAIKRW